MFGKICIIIVALGLFFLVMVFGIALVGYIRMKFSKESPEEQKEAREEWTLYL